MKELFQNRPTTMIPCPKCGGPKKEGTAVLATT